MIIDGIKTNYKDNIKFFLLDQFAHLFVIIAIWVSISHENINFIASLLHGVWNSQKILIIILGYLFVLWPSGYFLRHMLKPFQDKFEEKEKRGLEKAGLWIGSLERFLTYSFMLGGYMEAIGFLLAAKSIFRFGEIRDPRNREETEYILYRFFIKFWISHYNRLHC